MPSVHPDLLDALKQGLHASLCVGLGFAALWGLWLLLTPSSAQRFAGHADRWIGSETWFEQLNRPIETARWFYRHHKSVGSLIAAAAALSLWRYLAAYDRVAVMGLLDRRWVTGGMDWLIPAAEAIFLSFNALFLIFGCVVAFRPSLLKLPERVANRWVVVDPQNALDRRFDPLAPAVARHPRLVGAGIAVLCCGLLWELIALA